MSGTFDPMLGAGFLGSPLGGVSAKAPGAFDIVDIAIVNCALVFGRQTLTCEDTILDALSSPDLFSGVIYAKVSHPSAGTPSLSIGSNSNDLPENTLDATYRLLYKASSDGHSWIDYRGAPMMFALN